MPRASHIYLDGDWIAAGTDETFDCHNPLNGSVVGTYQQGDEDDARRAVDAAVDAADAWGDTPAPERGAILADASDLLAERKGELTELLTREEGKTHAEAAPEVQRAIDIFAYYGEKARDLGGVVKAAGGRDTTLSTRREPLGPVALITPWNYPIAIPAWKLAPALAAGNTAVLKPASQAPGVAEAIVECLDEAGLPDGVLNFVTGPGSSVGDALLRDDRIEAVSFTGSTQVGKHVQDVAGDTGKRIQLEMGGKNPTVVMPSADVEEAADIVADGAFGVTGQACTATSRAIVHEDVVDDVVEAIVQRAEGLELGDGAAGADMGPQVSEDELAGTLEYIEVARDEGATLATGGGRPDDEDLADGHFVEPTVFTDVDPDMRIAQEEVFGPVLAVIAVSDFEEAMAVANGVPYGLSASIVTEDLGEANRFVDDIEAGVAKVNEKTTGLELHVPFGGLKDSSSETYREQGDAGLDFFSITKTVYMNY
jgi:aldehyde dehydrogenase (NAD+)